MPNFRKQHRSPLINALRKAFFIAREAQKAGSVQAEDLIEEFVQRRSLLRV